jgi:UDP-glucose 4-epimerase
VLAVVTGHRGFLGGHVAAALELTDWTVVGAGRPDVEVPSTSLDELLRRASPDVVVHCAGPASVQAAEDDPEADRRGSVDVLASLLDRLALLTESRLVLVSSAAVYGEPTTLPVTVDAPISPISAYGRHRAECEQLAAASGVPTSFARVFSAYGEGLNRQVWWDIARRASRGEPVTLSGSGNESRDFVHGEDAGRALAAIATRAEFRGEAYNVAMGRETTIASLAHSLVEAIGSGSEVAFSGLARRGDPTRWRADISETEALGFEAAISIDEGIGRYARWIRSAQ